MEQRARAEQIVGVIVRYGVAEMSSDADGHAWLAELAGHARPDPELVALSRGERLCAAAQELGTTFIKIGQILSTRADLVGADVADALRDGAGELLESLELFDVFTGDQVGQGNKSLAFALRFRAGDRTLTEDEANTAKLAAVEEADRRIGARLR